MRQLQSHLARVRRLADALLYEGYLLYPYRRSAQKNQRRWMFGTLLPRAHSEALGGLDPWRCQSELLLEGNAETRIAVVVRFLHFRTRFVDGGASFEEGTERTIEVDELRLAELLPGPQSHLFAFAAERAAQYQQPELQGCIELTAAPVAPGVWQLRVQVMNTTSVAAPDGRLTAGSNLFALASVHALVIVQEGRFVSQIDPGAELQPLSAQCRNEGLFPVLLGPPGARDLMLCAPIIVSDYPEIAPESPGDLFDATEIDEILTLRLLTLSDDEKREVTAGDERARRLLLRVEQLDEAARAALHGALREPRPPRCTMIAGVQVGPGTRVRLRPRAGADVLDLALAGRLARVTSLEEDFEGRLYVAVAVEDDPGHDLGQRGQPGHRFFFFCDEVEPLDAEACA